MMTAAVTFPFGLIPLETDPNAVGAPFTHDHALVGASMLVAVAMSFAFLELVARSRAHSRHIARLWSLAAGAAVGLCLWFVHAMGLIALESPLLRGFAIGPTGASLAIALATGCVTMVMAGARAVWWRTLLAGLCIGVGAIAMHYVGMSGLEIEAELTYRPPLILATSVGAFSSSIFAIWLSHRLTDWRRRAIFAFPMGAVTAGLHYCDVAATVMTVRPAFATPAPALPQETLGFAIMLATGVVVFLSLMAASVDRVAARQREATRDAHMVVIPEASADGADSVVVLTDRRSRGR